MDLLASTWETSCCSVLFVGWELAGTLLVFGFSAPNNRKPCLSYVGRGSAVYAVSCCDIFSYVLVFYILFSYENYVRSGHWEIRGLIFAICGVTLDSLGWVLTRHGLK